MTDKTDIRATLFDQLDDVRAGLLGVRDSGQHMQPMNHNLDTDRSTIWFITSRKTDLVAALGTDSEAEFTITGKDQDFWASITGSIRISDDEKKLDEVWSVVAAAWFENGREDPDVCLLSLKMRSAAVWTATGNPLSFAYQIAKGNMAEGAEPDVGVHEVINFP